MPFKWDAEAERKLLLYIVKRCEVKPGTEVFDGVPGVLGADINPNACQLVFDYDGYCLASVCLKQLLTTYSYRQRFYKLKRESEQLLAKAGIETPATPSGKKKTPSKAKATPKSTGKGQKRKFHAEDDNDDDAAGTPSKKPKKVAKEDAEDEDY